MTQEIVVNKYELSDVAQDESFKTTPLTFQVSIHGLK